MNIYVDFDDVICETARNLSEIAERLYGIKVAYPDIAAFDLHEAFGLDDKRYHELMAVAHTREEILKYAETDRAAATLNKWLDGGHHVEIVTGRPFITAGPSREWLDSHGLQRLPVIHVDKYGREPPSPPGAPRALTIAEFQQRQYGFAVEDSPAALAHLEAMPGCRTAVFARPWNAKTPLRPGFTRCADWKAVDALLATLADTAS